MIVASVAIRSAFFDNGNDSGRRRRQRQPQRIAPRVRHRAGRRVRCDRRAPPTGASLSPSSRPAPPRSGSRLRRPTAAGAVRRLVDAGAVAGDRRERAASRRRSIRCSGTPSAPIARSPLVIAIRRERRAVLAGTCGGADRLDAASAEQAGKAWSALRGGDPTWGSVNPAHGQPVQTAVGALVLAQAAGTYLATPERADRARVEQRLAERPEVHRVRRLVPAAGDVRCRPKRSRQPPTSFDTLAAAQPRAVLPGRRHGGPSARHPTALNHAVDVIYPATVSTADVVFAPVRGTNGDLARAVQADRKAYSDQGWRVGPWGPPPGAPASAAPSCRRATASPGRHGRRAAGLLVAGGAMTPARRALVALVACALVALAACSRRRWRQRRFERRHRRPRRPGKCTPIDVAVSSEKIALLTKLADDFNASDAVRSRQRQVRVRRACEARRRARRCNCSRRAGPTPTANGPQPIVWSPAATSWAAILEPAPGRPGPTGDGAAPSDPIMTTPLVIAMPKPMADALGYPDKPIGYADILALARNPKGWGAYGHPEWGPFRLGKTNPNFSTSALHATIAQYYAATGKTSGPHPRRPRPSRRPPVRPRCRVVGRPLRRHHDDLPQQLVPQRRARHVAHLRVGGGRRGEVGHRLQRGQPRRRPRPR